MSDKFRHGVYVTESATPVPVPVTGESCVQVVIGTAPVNMADDPAAMVNTPILCTSATDAMEKLGYSDDFTSYTLCQTMFLTRGVYPCYPVVYINVLDPATHKTALAEVEVDVAKLQATVKTFGIIKEGLVVKQGSETEALVLNTDYTLSFDSEGYLVVTLISTGAAAAATKLKVSGFKLDPAAVTAADIVGEYNVNTGVETGIQLIRQVFPKLSVVPGLILAPGWSQNTVVGQALMAKTEGINGVFRCEALLDLDTTQATKPADVKTVKEACGYTSIHSYVLWPCDKIDGKVFYKSAVVAAMLQYTVTANGDVPSMSPSNQHTEAVSAQCLANGTEIVLDLDQANEVNSYGVATSLNFDGYRVWGNYTGAYPEESDPKDIWINVRRMFTWQANTFIRTYFDRVDDLLNVRLIETIVDSENIRCAALAPASWAGASIEYRPEDNPIEQLMQGKIVFKQKLAPYLPAQVIENDLVYDVDLLRTALGGE